jgi:arylsulfatase A-like enzyme
MPPNIVSILTDDLAVGDLNPNTLKHMPNLRALMEKGTTFDNAFVSNDPPLGGFEKFRYLGHENSTVATWLGGAGYRTSLVGKYLNGYAGTYFPPGWDDWRAISGNFLSNGLNENGHLARYDPERYYLDDLLSQKATDFVGRGGTGSSLLHDQAALLPERRHQRPPPPHRGTRMPTPTSSCRIRLTSTRRTSRTSLPG